VLTSDIGYFSDVRIAVLSANVINRVLLKVDKSDVNTLYRMVRGHYIERLHLLILCRSVIWNGVLQMCGFLNMILKLNNRE